MLSGSNWRNNIITRKGRRWLYSAARPIVKAFERPSDAGPIVANSFPKSGTHLLIQILEVVPGIKDWAMFVPSHPSTKKRERSAKRVNSALSMLVKRELVAAHLYFSDETEERLSSIGAAHFFIIRDLRDVVVSEAMYLRYKNRWHYMHRYFKNCKTDSDAIDLAINGLANSRVSYPNIFERFSRYKGWLNSSALTVRYEDLMGEGRGEALREIGIHLSKKGHLPSDTNISGFCALAEKNICPSRSHTFRSAKSQGWKENLNDKQIRNMIELCGEELSALGYDI